ncbi:DUF6779 domain-containing protein [Umezawaea tangerina]|uniref:DUF6779 domain-containing protein n=1 Tax=Umezawaea tangerina TaxID=84725 RepID=A0A2T0TKQ8_9PSEU|nr:DUF6779 domain-containing protein [Umezawaea tangerina]PRY46253.1 hypothetical protein CLV43_101526 [Umezawaea tangerina]
MALALVAAALLVLSDNARYLRLAVVSALWAALVGAFLAARYRRQVADREDEVADLQSVYELELEREVAARREYELEIEAESRKRIQEESRDDLDALRDELRALRENLQALLGGEVLVERVALRAESTRMRSLSDQSRLMAIGDRQIINTEGDRVRGITAGPAKPAVKKVVAEQPPAVERTELIERVVAETRKPARQEPVRPSTNYTEPVRREPSRPQQRPAQPPIVVRRDPPKPERSPEPPKPPVRRDQPTARTNRSDVFDSMEMGLGQLGQPFQEQRRPEAPRLPEPPKPAPKQPARGPRPPVERTGMFQSEAPRPAEELPQTSGRRRAADERPKWEGTGVYSTGRGEPVKERPSWDGNGAYGTGRGEPVKEKRPGWEGGSPNGTGRGEPVKDRRPGWEGGGAFATGRGEPVKPGRRSAPDPDDPAGAHADGKSVSELLASLGNTESPRRRRRREED